MDCQRKEMISSKLQFIFVLSIVLVACFCSSTNKKVVNYPNTEILETISVNDTIKLDWLDAVGTTNFGFYLYSTTQNLSDLANISKAGTVVQISKTSTSITLNSSSTTAYNLIRVYTNITKVFRFKLTHTKATTKASYYIYGVYTPPANKINLIPFVVTNVLPCQYTIQRAVFVSSFSNNIVVQLIPPGADPLTGASAANFTVNALATVTIPSLPNPTGTWFMKFTSTLSSKASATTGIAA